MKRMERIRCVRLASAPQHSLQRFDQAGYAPRKMSRKRPDSLQEVRTAAHHGQPSKFVIQIEVRVLDTAQDVENQQPILDCVQRWA